MQWLCSDNGTLAGRTLSIAGTSVRIRSGVSSPPWSLSFMTSIFARSTSSFVLAA